VQVGDELAILTNIIHQVWSEVRDLVRVTRVDEPEAALLAPEQAFFLRENLKLRLLNARLALLSDRYSEFVGFQQKLPGK
jgi:uroporphyrin-3 C-methyltransferase